MPQPNLESTSYDSMWLDAFIKTQIIELSLGLIICSGYVLCQSKSLEDSRFHLVSLTQEIKAHYSFLKLLHVTLVFLIATSITHPILWYVLPYYIYEWGLSYHVYILIGELFVWLTEALWYYLVIESIQKRYILALCLSLVLNAASYFIGVYLW